MSRGKYRLFSKGITVDVRIVEGDGTDFEPRGVYIRGKYRDAHYAPTVQDAFASLRDDYQTEVDDFHKRYPNGKPADWKYSDDYWRDKEKDAQKAQAMATLLTSVLGEKEDGNGQVE